MKRLLFGGAFGVLLVCGWLILDTPRVFAAPPPCAAPPARETYIGVDCYGGWPLYADCLSATGYNGYKNYHYRPDWYGYFDTLNAAAIPPDPANPAKYFPGSPAGSAPCNVVGDNTDALAGLQTAADPTAYFKLQLSCLLIGQVANNTGLGAKCIPNGNDYPNKVGAAFVVDSMLNYQPYGTSSAERINNGIADAQANFGKFTQLVDYYASSTDPASYGVIWNLSFPTQQDYCNTLPQPINNSAYSPDTGEPVYWQQATPAGASGPCDTSDCANLPTAGCYLSIPMVRFYWRGGIFDIGQHCANIQYFTGPIPQDSAPVGTISMSCNGTQQVAKLTFSDADSPGGATAAYITTGKWPSPPYPPTPPDFVTGTSGSITIPASATDPYVPQPVYLYVQDVGPTGSPGTWVQVASANTSVPCVVVSCNIGSISTTPTPLDPLMSFTATASVGISAPPPPGTMMNLTITAPPGQPPYPPNGAGPIGPAPVTYAGGLASASFTNLPATTGAGGTYKASWSIAGVSGTCNGSFTVGNLPYVSVYGGDALAGGGPALNGAGQAFCAANGGAGIYGWNNYSSDYSGAGAEYAVQALSYIDGFASAQDASPDARPPLDLSFANSKVNINAGLFGGFMGQLPLAPDRSCDFAEGASSLSNVQANRAVQGLVDAGGIAAGAKPTVIYTNGDVYISGNLMYNTAGWTNVSQIPSFTLVTQGGNIYINENVTQLDGLYVAEPDSNGNGGVIYDCASGRGAPVPINVVSGGVDPGYQACNNQLVVNGAFAAKQIRFMRTYGSLGGAGDDSLSSSNAAEVFNYTPELWLPRGGFEDDNSYTAITGLPPVL